MTTPLEIPRVTDPDSIPEEALRYADVGMPVLPLWWPEPDGTCACRDRDCKSPGKHPIGRLVPHGLASATTDPAEIRRWWARYPNANLGGRTGDLWDVLDFDSSAGVALYEKWKLDHGFEIESVGEVRSGREDAAGTHLFVPATGRGNGAGPGIDFRGRGGYIVLPPSLHVSGRRYEIIRDPREKALEGVGSAEGFLDEVFVGGKSRVENAAPAASWVEINDFTATYTEKRDPGLITPQIDRFRALVEGGNSRHGSLSSVITGVARDAMMGSYPADEGFEQLRDAFDEVKPEADYGEFDRLLLWAVGQVQNDDPEQLRAERDERLEKCELTPLPDNFWSRRPEFMHILTAARSRGAAPDAVLHCVLARVSSMQDPRATVDVGDGPIGLNYFTCPVGISGKGKGKAMGVANSLVPVPLGIVDKYLDGVPPGSGEGIPEMFYGMIPENPADPTSKKERGIARENALIVVDEGETLQKLTQRSGATLGITLRTAFSGNTLGSSNASTEKTRIVPRGTYALGMMVGLQPGKLDTLFDKDEVAGGTPQRFTFVDAQRDPGALPRGQRPEWPGELSGEAMRWPRHWSNPIPWLPDEAPGDDAYREMRGEVPASDDLNGHLDLIIIRVAVLLAVLSSRSDGVNDEDLELARMIVDKSTVYRDRLFGERLIQEQAASEAQSKSQVRTATLTLISGSKADADLTRITKWITGKAEDGTRVRVGDRSLWRRLASRDRDPEVFEAALSRFLAQSEKYEVVADDEGEDVLRSITA